MASIAGFGVYLPRYRIKAEEIQRAWGRSGGRGEKGVAARDEDVLTMGARAAQTTLAQANLDGPQLGAIYFASVSSGYAENALAAQLAHFLRASPNVSVADIGLSTRSVTSALEACADAIMSGRIKCGLVVGSDRLIAKPGSDYELSYGAGAGAVVLGQEGFARIESFASYTSGFVGRSRAEGGFHGPVDERFVMKHGFMEHTRQAAQQLVRVTDITFEQLDLAVLQAPDSRWAMRTLATLGLDGKKLVSTFAHIGYAGCASFLIDLAWALERAHEGQRILAISYGPGGSDALALCVEKAIGNANGPLSVEGQLAHKEYLSYTRYLLYVGLRGDLR